MSVETFNSKLSTCPHCGKKLRVTSDIVNYRLWARCTAPECGNTFEYPVAPHLTVPHIFLFSMTLSLTVLSISYTGNFTVLIRILLALPSLIIIFVLLMIVFRLLAYIFLHLHLSPSFQYDLVSFIRCTSKTNDAQKISYPTIPSSDS